MTGTGPAVTVRDLVKSYAGRAVLDGVSFEVPRGEIFALLGPNGAGKTTTVEIVEGYRRADRGTVRVLGVDPAKGGAALRARVGLMLQEGGMEPRARVGELVRLYAAFHAVPRDPGELIDLVGLRSVERTPYRRLSGGERQRLALAVALVGRPEILILDEPTAGMDPAARAATRDLLRTLRGEGATILLTTHDLVDVEKVADRVAILVGGRIAALGTPADLVVSGPPRLSLRFATRVSPTDLASLSEAVRRGRRGVRVVPVPGDPAAATIEAAIRDPSLLTAVTTWAEKRGLPIADLRSAGGSLEDRYLELTGGAPTAAAEAPAAAAEAVVDTKDIA